MTGLCVRSLLCVAWLRRQRGLQPFEGSAGLGFQGGALTRLLVGVYLLAGGLAPPSEAFSQRQAWAPRTPQSGCFKGRKHPSNVYLLPAVRCPKADEWQRWRSTVERAEETDDGLERGRQTRNHTHTRTHMHAHTCSHVRDSWSAPGRKPVCKQSK